MPLQTVDALDKGTLQSLFKRIGEKLNAQGLSADITIYGGAALMLRYGFRESTHDVDVVMDRWDEPALKMIASEVAAERHLNTHWFNDDVQHMTGEREQTDLYMVYPSTSKPALRVHTPKPEYMLALQVRALERAHLSEDAAAPLGKHVTDVHRLADNLGFNKSQTLDCVRFFFPTRRLPPVVLKWLDVTFDEQLEPAMA